jgi:hypothetical protein
MEESMSKKGLIISISITQVLLVLLALVVILSGTLLIENVLFFKVRPANCCQSHHFVPKRIIWCGDNSSFLLKWNN